MFQRTLTIIVLGVSCSNAQPSSTAINTFEHKQLGIRFKYEPDIDPPDGLLKPDISNWKRFHVETLGVSFLLPQNTKVAEFPGDSLDHAPQRLAMVFQSGVRVEFFISSSPFETIVTEYGIKRQTHSTNQDQWVYTSGMGGEVLYRLDGLIWKGFRCYSSFEVSGDDGFHGVSDHIFCVLIRPISTNMNAVFYFDTTAGSEQIQRSPYPFTETEFYELVSSFEQISNGNHR